MRREASGSIRGDARIYLGGVVVGLGFLIEIQGLHGRDQLGDRPVESLAVY